MRNERNAFTLVELLIVIGIIGVLMGILLPTISTARGSARRSVCASNLRQLQLAVMNYAMDNEGWLPPAHLHSITKNLHRWHGTRPSVTDPADPSKQMPFDFAGSPLRQYLQTPQIKQCPDFEPPADGFERSAGGYGYNNHYLGSSIEEVTGPMSLSMLEKRYANRPARMEQVRSAAQTVCFADVAMASPNLIEYSFVEPPLAKGSPTSPSIHFRHRGRANIVWLDGHVTAEVLEWTYPTNAYLADNRQLGLGFFGPRDNSLFDRQ